MAEKPGNQTPDTPDVSETELRNIKVDDLRDAAKEAGVSGVHDMKKEDLVDALAAAKNDGGRPASGGDGDGERGDSGDAGAGPDGGKVRTGPDSSDSLKYSQEVTSPEDEPEREGRSLVTTHHEVIKQWAEERNATPATVSGTEHDDHLGVLRFDFGGESQDLQHVSWDEWFKTFDERRLNFIYQEQRTDGTDSNFFRLENPNREDA
ncbi:Rho termination factor N-terminal domain-containing protein [Arthrobacter crystallopoietes]|uniref:Rho termination factor, N-terminal domain n=1 Tax=Crystallibacter crystallopoietes TaxID=37928 RepID=A0A1H1EQY2_9MICC|nr:Rho termination factor N-terminal domain-containing protein [Arthrobacter crystallopoietes]SDQ91152.1 Rho termination factor, N-terminal domain [Arthrobacter crystallopoietes]